MHLMMCLKAFILRGRTSKLNCKKGAASQQGNALVHVPLMSAVLAFPSKPCVILILHPASFKCLCEAIDPLRAGMETG